MCKVNEMEFGYLPLNIRLPGGHGIEVIPRPGIDEIIKSTKEKPNISNWWHYHTSQVGRDRVFSLPKTHVIYYEKPVSSAKSKFLIWCLSFFSGMRLTTESAGFLDATPIKEGKLVDFLVDKHTLSNGLRLANDYWEANSNNRISTKLVESIIHCLFLAQTKGNFPFERFLYLYMALDGCYRLYFESLTDEEKPKNENGEPKNLPHSKRIKWLCCSLKIRIPSWAKAQRSKAKRKVNLVSKVRASAVHEGLFGGEPLGFSTDFNLDEVPDSGNMLLEMEALICRMIVALLGEPNLEYVHSCIRHAQSVDLDFSKINKPQSGTQQEECPRCKQLYG